MSRNLSLLAATAALATLDTPARPSRRLSVRPLRRAPPGLRNEAARRIDRSAGLLALAALCDSSVEHYRGSFHNKAMYVPLAVSVLALALHPRSPTASKPRRDSASAAVDYLALATGLAGTGFHLYNVGKRPGGFSWLNLFYAAPLGAPAALSLAGMLRRASAYLRGGRRRLAGMPAERVFAGLLSLGLLGTTVEAALLHFRGAYQNAAMFIPVTVGPAAAAALAYAAVQPRQAHPITRWLLRALAGIGILGAGFHAYGIGRDMGGWRNWSQNLLNGPPLPAPPSFSALAFAGLAVLNLIERGKR